MLRGDTIICGTSTTGNGTLTLAACPNPPGGVDLYAWLTATGLNFMSGNAVLVSYVLIEYADTTYSQAVNYEKGVGTVTLGASLSATTLARTTVQNVAGSLNSTGAPTYSSPSAVSIGTPANVLLFIGPSAADVPAYSPYYENTLSGLDNLGVTADSSIGSGATGNALVSLTNSYSIFRWSVPMMVKKCSMYVVAGAGSVISSAFARIYQINSLGRPGKLLVDFGAFAGPNPLNNSSAKISATALGTGFLLLPGEYYFDFLPSFSGGSPKMQVINGTSMWGNCRMGMLNFTPVLQMSATGGTAGPAPDPANLTSYTYSLAAFANLFTLNVS